MEMNKTIAAKSLRNLLKSIPGFEDFNVPDILVSGIKHDSRKIQPGDVFVAIQGDVFDGHQE